MTTKSQAPAVPTEGDAPTALPSGMGWGDLAAALVAWLERRWGSVVQAWRHLTHHDAMEERLRMENAGIGQDVELKVQAVLAARIKNYSDAVDVAKKVEASGVTLQDIKRLVEGTPPRDP